MKKDHLKQFAVSNSLFAPTTLGEAFSRLRFVQIDPIRSPARAQDLILRHRVLNYKKDDIEKQATAVNLEEDYLYAHGFMLNDIWQLLHPREKIKLSGYDKKVFEHIQKTQKVDKSELEKELGSKRERNWWGGMSQASRMALERLHYYGFIKIVKREKGARMYAPFEMPKLNLSKGERLEKLIMAVVQILQPVTPPTLRQSLFRLRRFLGPSQEAIKSLLDKGVLIKQAVDGADYLFVKDSFVPSEVDEKVRFLAPFDPVVWDRVRFEQLWGWPYRFEAYVPKNKRVRGYYAMPLLWRNEVIGWANVSKEGEVDLGFVNNRPKEKSFDIALDQEITDMKDFLKV